MYTLDIDPLPGKLFGQMQMYVRQTTYCNVSSSE